MRVLSLILVLLCSIMCLSFFAIILVAVLCLLALCLVTVIVLWFFLTMPWIGLQCVIVVFLEHTHLSFINPLLHSLTIAPCDAFEISCI